MLRFTLNYLFLLEIATGLDTYILFFQPHYFVSMPTTTDMCIDYHDQLFDLPVSFMLRYSTFWYTHTHTHTHRVGT